jgi:hypothetical protein
MITTANDNTNILLSLSSLIKKYKLIPFIQIYLYFASIKSRYNYAINSNLESFQNK